MSNVTIRQGRLEDIAAIQNIAEKSWWKVYRPILAAEQIEYMLNKIYSSVALEELFAFNIQKFRILLEDGSPKGFLAYGAHQADPTVYKIHKLYVLPETQGKGFGRMLIDDVKEKARAEEVFILELNVNRFNPAKSFYERVGFSVLREEDVPIGPYWMNDFVMQMPVLANT